MEKKTPAKSPVPAALDWVCSLAAAAVAVVPLAQMNIKWA